MHNTRTLKRKQLNELIIKSFIPVLSLLAQNVLNEEGLSFISASLVVSVT